MVETWTWWSFPEDGLHFPALDWWTGGSLMLFGQMLIVAYIGTYNDFFYWFAWFNLLLAMPFLYGMSFPVYLLETVENDEVINMMITDRPSSVIFRFGPLKNQILSGPYFGEAATDLRRDCGQPTFFDLLKNRSKLKSKQIYYTIPLDTSIEKTVSVPIDKFGIRTDILTYSGKFELIANLNPVTIPPNPTFPAPEPRKSKLGSLRLRLRKGKAILLKKLGRDIYGGTKPDLCPGDCDGCYLDSYVVGECYLDSGGVRDAKHIKEEFENRKGGQNN